MSNLKHSKIYRSGITARAWAHETRECTFGTNAKERSMEFRFCLASKGGGTTEVLLQVGIEDLPQILEAIATKFPESADYLSTSAAIANRKNLELLEDARRMQNNESELAQDLINKLELVEQYVSEKYYEAPAGEDEKETAARDSVAEVLSTLRDRV
jgi:hypothetical protein